ncbi:hypothetical protein HanPSC8_Chr02g0059081 [Helianthus annuus]|nr:hypothetical protein HanPSC8_Chr02g0059081 [Helianthus annuus]
MKIVELKHLIKKGQCLGSGGVRSREGKSQKNQNPNNPKSIKLKGKLKVNRMHELGMLIT